jgi:hypothetical protein
MAAQAAWAQSATTMPGASPAGRLFAAALASDYAAVEPGFLIGPDLYAGRLLRLRGPQSPDLRRDAFKVRAENEISVARDWPAAVRLQTRRLDVDLTPHAAFDLSPLGRSVEAGAMVRVSPSLEDRALDSLRDLGVGDGARFGDRGRWYLFAATSGRAVGLNMLRNDAGWNRAGWTTDPASALVGDAQLGVGWRKGAMQSSLGYVYREVKGQHMVFGQDTKRDSLLAVTLSIKPGS